MRSAANRLGEGDALELRRLVEEGLPTDAVASLIERVPKAARPVWRQMLPLPEKGARLGPDLSDRAVRLAYLLSLAREVWGGEARAAAFLTRPHPALDGKPPLEAIRTEWGGRAVEELLRKLQFGLPA